MTSFIQSIGGTQAGTKRPQDRRNYFPLKGLTGIQATVSSLHRSTPFIYHKTIKIFITLSYSSTVLTHPAVVRVVVGVIISWVFNINQFAIHQCASIYYHFPGCSILFLHAQYRGKKPPGTPFRFIHLAPCLPACHAMLE